VLVLNASMEPIHVCSFKRAVVLLLREKAELIENTGEILRSKSVVVAYPAVIRLIAYVHIPQVHWGRVSRAAVLARDNWQCQYCGDESRLTIDHVIPRGRGGEHVWANVVAACGSCNQRKGDRLPGEVGFRLRQTPRQPGRGIFILVAVRRLPEIWEPYVA
jgi:5-methylcytosine-specific restriction endonuclease McrA